MKMRSINQEETGYSKRKSWYIVIQAGILRIILNSREDASLANIICRYVSHQSSPLLINIIFHQLQPYWECS